MSDSPCIVIAPRRWHAYLLILLMAALFAGGAWRAPASELVEAARDQIGKTVIYDSGYQVIDYPNGDIPIDRGVCTDVIIRALRRACDIDLQRLVHEDMSAHFSQYPGIWGLHKPDKNIDHRRVPNLRTFFQRKGWDLPVSDRAADYKPGDLVTCKVPPNLPHIMMVSDRKNRKGTPFVIHNIGLGTREEDRLFEFEITGHYQLPAMERTSLTGAVSPANGQPLWQKLSFMIQRVSCK